ncbi:MAG TPA: pyridoxamine 5'-phosphate oxidase family protein [Thermoanaerobaculia bacterium]|nr:pyridoxamine 5'-phosphate oxidase family protein [Thermoanaerobaculia bacterium]
MALPLLGVFRIMAEEKLQRFYDLIEDLETAMFTTRRPDGHLVSRPMAVQKRAAGADLWFVTMRGSHKLDELANDAHVNLAFYKDRTREWVSVSGRARVTDDRAKIRELYALDWRAWFGDEGGEKDGTPDDPRMILIGVDVEMAMFLELNKPQPVVLYEVVKGMITGRKPDLGEVERVP